MVFHNPWGLLALLSIPIILGLHFFHSRRRERRVGGLHLWEFARIRMPAGRRFDRFIRNLPLLFQLLAALLLSLLLAGFDVPLESRNAHYTVILDDSASMGAGAGEDDASAARARDLIEGLGRSRDRFTVVSAGARPDVLAGPFATKDETKTALADWAPRAPSCDLEAAVNLAAKFAAEGEAILFVTDEKAAGAAYSDALSVAAVGRPLDNAAIDLADRMRVSPDKDRVFVTAQTYSKLATDVTLRAFVGEREVFGERLTLEPGRPRALRFDVGAVGATIRLAIDGDTLAADNSATLAPVGIKTTRVAVRGLDAVDEYFVRAVQAVEYTALTDDPSEADLLFTTDAETRPSPDGPIRVCVLPDPAVVEASRGGALLAQGRDIVSDHNSPVVDGLSLDGVLWPLAAGAGPPPEGARSLLSWRGRSLLSIAPSPDKTATLRLNLVADRTNLFRQTAWPVLARGLIEECRDALPGMASTNFRVGEDVALSVAPREGFEGGYVLTRDGETFGRYETPPAILTGLPIGTYEFAQDDGERLALFCVNLFAPGESDLRPLDANEPDLKNLTTASVRRAEANHWLALAIVALIICLTAGAWISQDTSL